MKKIIFILLSLIYIGHNTSFSQSSLLVKFGASAGQNVYNTVDFPGWTNANTSDSTIYTTIDGVSGTALQYSGNEYTNFQSISGTAMQFSYGDRIFVTWYNGTGSQANFRPLISFTATGKPVNQTGQPLWYITDDLWIEGQDSITTQFDITDTAHAAYYLPASEGNYGIVNISMNTTQTDIICMRIEIGLADTVAPEIPQNVHVTSITYNSVSLSWDPSNDNTGGDSLFRYKIYIDGLYHGFSYSTDYTAYYLSPEQNHSFQVTAVDRNKNESAKSAVLNQTTLPFSANQDLINPTVNLEYLGAYKLPTSFEWMDGDPAFYPNGDPASTDSFPGSIYMPGIPTLHLVAETTIPSPVISTDTSQLPFASFLQDFADARSLNMNDGGGNWSKGPAFEWLPQQTGQTQGYLYTCFGDYYQVGGERLNSFGACNTDLSNPQPVGGWYIGDPTVYTEPSYMTTISFNFEIPYEVNSHRLIAAGNRYGQWHRGPVLVGYSPWNDQAPLPANLTQLDHTNLLMYEDIFGNHWLNGYAEQDIWTGGAWLTAGSKSAVVIAGLKGFGESWYGYYDGEDFQDLLCVPTPGESEDHGPRQTRFKSVFLFYNPDDLEAVANGSMQPYEPQPYACLDIQDVFLNQNNDDSRYDWFGPGGMTYDRTNGYIYLVERMSNPTLNICAPPVVHVWKINDSLTTITENMPGAEIEIFSSGKNIYVKSDNLIDGGLTIYNILGEPVYQSKINNCYSKTISTYLREGIYLVSLINSKETITKKILLE